MPLTASEREAVSKILARLSGTAIRLSDARAAAALLRELLDGADFAVAGAISAGDGRRNLTPRQKQLFEFIAHGIDANGYAPSYREMQDYLSSGSLSHISHLVDEIVARGWLTKAPGRHRSLQLVRSKGALA